MKFQLSLTEHSDQMSDMYNWNKFWLPHPNLKSKISNSAKIKLDGNVLDIYFRKEILATFFNTVTYLLDDPFTASDMKQSMRCTKYDTASLNLAFLLSV